MRNPSLFFTCTLYLCISLGSPSFDLKEDTLEKESKWRRGITLLPCSLKTFFQWISSVIRLNLWTGLKFTVGHWWGWCVLSRFCFRWAHFGSILLVLLFKMGSYFSSIVLSFGALANIPRCWENCLQHPVFQENCFYLAQDCFFFKENWRTESQILQKEQAKS